MNSPMQWSRLLSRRRLGTPAAAEAPDRTAFQRDYDRIAFSSAFRRLQDKTQVFPLAESDYVRTRLTHSLEAACVGRSLGTLVGQELEERGVLPEATGAADVGAIVAAACLAHDIGNPPFGHSGEDAIGHWFSHSEAGIAYLGQLTEPQAEDLRRFEGNAQGFRLVARLQNPDSPGGLGLTCATLGAFFKYPRTAARSEAEREYAGASNKKYGLFEADRPLFTEVADEVGLLPRVVDESWYRHPLAFLVEAADDICYRIVDLEDAFRLGHVAFAETEALLLAVTGDQRERLARIAGEKEKIAYLRAKAINTLVGQCAEAFLARETALLNGGQDRPLTDTIALTPALEAIERVSIAKAYNASGVVEIEAAGFEVIGRLLELFLGALGELAEAAKPSARATILGRLLPEQCHRGIDDPYRRALNVTDYVSGMTDSFAVALYKKVTGISLPNR